MYYALQEVGDEVVEVKAQQRGLRHEHVSLQRNLKGLKEKVVDLEQRALEVQILKFGQVRASLWQFPHSNRGIRTQ